nr:hypothetical protein BHI3_06230 [Bacteriovorax sp. HI3]
MLKHLYKTLLISVISWSLLTVQSSVVFAAATESKATVTTDSNGVITAKKSVSFEKVSDTDMLASITMLAGGFIAGRMWQAYSPVSIDVTIAAAGGVAFIAGEVMSNIKFKGTIDAMTVEVEKKSDGTINEEQIQRLQDLKKSYEEAKKTTKTKKTLQLAAAAAFGAAALTATYMAYSEEGAIQSCLQTLNYASGALDKCIAAGATGVGATESGACTACKPLMEGYRASFMAYSKARTPPGQPSGMKDKAVFPYELTAKNPMNMCSEIVAGATVTTLSKSVQGACLPAANLLIKDQQSAPNPITGDIVDAGKILGLPAAQHFVNSPQIKTNIFANYLERSLSFIFPEAQAGWLPMLGLGAGTLLAFSGILGTMGVSVDTYMFVPMNRAIAFGVLAGISYMASRSSDNIIKKLDDNIQKIDAILADMNKLNKGVKAQNLQNQSVAIKTINPSIQSAQPFSADGSAKTPCMTGNSSENCAKLADKLSSMPGFANLPDSLKGIASQSVSLGDSLSGSSGISGSTLTSAEALGNKQNAINKALKNQQAKLTKITNGKFDAGKEENKFKDKVNAALKKELQKHGMTATGFMASIGSTPMNSADSKNDKDSGSGKGVNFEGNAVNLAAGEATGEKEKEEGLKLEFKDTAPVGDGLALGAPMVSGSDHLDVKTDEINGQNGPSIFELISRRYFKSGYPKLLEEEPAKN